MQKKSLSLADRFRYASLMESYLKNVSYADEVDISSCFFHAW